MAGCPKPQYEQEKKRRLSVLNDKINEASKRLRSDSGAQNLVSNAHATYQFYRELVDESFGSGATRYQHKQSHNLNVMTIDLKRMDSHDNAQSYGGPSETVSR